MSRKTCKRRVWALINPISYAIEGASYTPENLLDKLRIRELSAIEAFVTGRAGLQEWSDLTAMHNLCETMAHGGVGPEALENCAAVEGELVAAAKCFEATRRMEITATGLEAFHNLFAWHDLQRQSIPRGEYEHWIKKTGDRMRSQAPGVVDVSKISQTEGEK